jgi:hypothetical protein
VVKNLKQLVSEVDWQHTLTGLALFASRDQAHSVTLPFRVKPRAMIDETFATRDLVYAMNRAAPYRVLVLGHTTQLYDAWTTVLEEHLAKPFPLVHKGPGGAAKLPGGVGINRSAARDEAQRQFFRSADEAVAKLQEADRVPLVVVGVERNLAFYREVTQLKEDIVGLLAGNHEKTSPSDLGKLVWPVFEFGATVRRTEALVQLDDAVSSGRYCSGIDQVWRAVVGKKCRILLVEREFKFPADLHEDGVRLLPHGPGSDFARRRGRRGDRARLGRRGRSVLLSAGRSGSPPKGCRNHEAVGLARQNRSGRTTSANVTSAETKLPAARLTAGGPFSCSRKMRAAQWLFQNWRCRPWPWRRPCCRPMWPGVWALN